MDGSGSNCPGTMEDKHYMIVYLKQKVLYIQVLLMLELYRGMPNLVVNLAVRHRQSSLKGKSRQRGEVLGCRVLLASDRIQVYERGSGNRGG